MGGTQCGPYPIGRYPTAFVNDVNMNNKISSVRMTVTGGAHCVSILYDGNLGGSAYFCRRDNTGSSGINYVTNLNSFNDKLSSYILNEIYEDYSDIDWSSSVPNAYDFDGFETKNVEWDEWSEWKDGNYDPDDDTNKFVFSVGSFSTLFISCSLTAIITLNIIAVIWCLRRNKKTTAQYKIVDYNDEVSSENISMNKC